MNMSDVSEDRQELHATEDDGGPGGHGDQHDHDDGHDGHSAMVIMLRSFQRLFWIMALVALPVVGFNVSFAGLLGYDLPDAEWARWIPPILGTIM